MHDRRPKGSITSPKLPCGGLCGSLHWRNMSLQLSAPKTVLISGQLQFSAWRLPVSVPFANFSSQGRHKTLGTPAAVHPNPVSSTSLDRTWGKTTSLCLAVVWCLRTGNTHTWCKGTSGFWVLLQHICVSFNAPLL